MDNIDPVNMDNQLSEALIQPVLADVEKDNDAYEHVMSQPTEDVIKSKDVWLEKNLKWCGQILQTSWMHRNFSMERQQFANIANTQLHITIRFYQLKPI
jgi:hypothetical protein